jgi:hypothetical protein
MAALGVVLGVIAKIVRIITWILVAIIVLGIVFAVLEANRHNVIVSSITDVARSLVAPFDGLFSLHDPKLRIAVNWGIGALVYLLVGLLIAGLIARLGVMVALSGDRRDET